MQEYEQLVPDAEMFARVWKRVMPDESMSPIVVHPPGATEPPKPLSAEQGSREGRVWLGEILEELDEGNIRAAEILRRDPGAWPLRDSMQKSAAQLRAAWLLLTGTRWKSRGSRYPTGGSTEKLLREQYLWEVRFSDLCRRAGKALQGADPAEIMPEQERESGRRRRMLRHMLGRRI